MSISGAEFAVDLQVLFPDMPTGYGHKVAKHLVFVTKSRLRNPGDQVALW